ncbi:MAG: hypothetical protein ACEQSQ_06195 [Candidatus Paceibacteria bacterium]
MRDFEFKYVHEAFSEEEKNQKECGEKLPYNMKEHWPIGCHPYISKNDISLQFWGWEIVLSKDGRYYINDTSGG